MTAPFAAMGSWPMLLAVGAAQIMNLPPFKRNEHFVVPDTESDLGLFDVMKTTELFQNPIEKRLGDILAKHKAAQPQIEEGQSAASILQWNEQVADMLDRVEIVKKKQEGLEPIVGKQLSEVDALMNEVKLASAENQAEQSNAEMMANMYNVAAPIANAQLSFAKQIDTQTEDAEKVENYESQQETSFDESLDTTATAVWAVSSTLAKFKDDLIPMLKGLNRTQDAIYATSEDMTVESNANVKRVEDIKIRTQTLVQQLADAHVVLTQLLQFANEKIVSNHAPAPPTDGEAAATAPAASMVQESPRDTRDWDEAPQAPQAPMQRLARIQESLIQTKPLQLLEAPTKLDEKAIHKQRRVAGAAAAAVVRLNSPLAAASPLAPAPLQMVPLAESPPSLEELAAEKLDLEPAPSAMLSHSRRRPHTGNAAV